MDQKSDRLYPSAPLQNNGLEQRVEKKLNNVDSFNNHINNIKEMITYFKNEKHKSIKRSKNYKTLITIIKSFDTIVITASTSSSITLSLT